VHYLSFCVKVVTFSSPHPFPLLRGERGFNGGKILALVTSSPLWGEEFCEALC